MKRILIVGAGIAGLTSAYLLAEKGHEVIVVERYDDVGGLSRTYKNEDFLFDSGPHRFYTKNDKVIRFINDVLGEEFLSMKMSSSVYIMGKYYDWPLGPKVILKLPFKVMLKAGLDMIGLIFKKKSPAVSFKEQILQKYGKTLYDIDFDPYTHKFTKIPTEKVHADWAKAGVNRAVIDENVKMDSIFSVVKNTLFAKRDNITIIYPKNGISDFSINLRDRISKMGHKVLLNAQPKSFEIKDKRIVAATLSNGTVIDNIDDVVWTGSINEASTLVGIQPRDLHYLNIMTYNVMLKGDSSFPYQWIYYVDSDVYFNRLYNTIRFSPYKAPTGYYGLCLEVTCNDGDEVMENPEKYYDTIIADMIKTKLIRSRDEVIGINHELLYQAYPVYRLNYRSELKTAFENIYSRVDNLTLAGRNGLFWYNNMDHSIENAFEVVDNILENKRNIAINEFWN